jgi:hypothetical protein
MLGIVRNENVLNNFSHRLLFSQKTNFYCNNSPDCRCFVRQGFNFHGGIFVKRIVRVFSLGKGHDEQ